MELMNGKTNLNTDYSEVSEFFAGLNVLITGGSGFLGKLLIEKILRSCPKVRKLYIIMRPKKGKTPAERFKEHFDDELYDKLKRERPDFINRVLMMEGDTSLTDLGLSSGDRKLLIESTHVIFHGAATVRFNEKLRRSIDINVRGTKLLLSLAKEMPNLKVFVHISTAFANCINTTIEEKFYEAPMDVEKIISVVELLDDDMLEQMTPALIGKWPNVYAFTKALGEEVIRKYSDGYPTCVVRPSMMLGTYKEPVTGWTNNFYGHTGAVAGGYSGLVHTAICNLEIITEVIPADYVINNIIVASWYIGKSWEKKCTGISSQREKLSENFSEKKLDNLEILENKEEKEPTIYNIVSSSQTPISWKRFFEIVCDVAKQYPSNRAVWYPFVIATKREWLFKVFHFLLHIIPALIIDTACRLTGRKSIMLKTYRMIEEFTTVITYFSLKEWKFSNKNVLELWDNLGAVDKEIFYFNLKYFDWNDYIYYFTNGVRLYLFKESLSNVEEARVRDKRLKTLHYTVVILMCILTTWAVITFVKFFL